MRFIVLLSAYWISDAVIYPVLLKPTIWVTLLFIIIGVIDVVEWYVKIKRELK